MARTATRTVPAILLFIVIGTVSSECPWNKDQEDLHEACICSTNTNGELTLQCSSVEFPVLLTVLRDFSNPIDLLSITNSSIPELPDGVFRQLALHNLHISKCGLKNVEEGAFQGQEESLKNLNLQDNQLTSVPSEAIKELRELTILDLSNNKISQVEDDTFNGLDIITLKLAENNLTISRHAFRGLEKTLRNLNLKGTRLREIPPAVQSLNSLAFLDLAQNNIRSIGAGILRDLDSLSALNLERNIIQALSEEAFIGVNDTLSSLSLLNNLITIYPVDAISSLTNLKVLDIGFNLLTEIPLNAFTTLKSLTLLAVDGNPVATLPEKAFTHLNKTLRGLSLGGRFLTCDCRIKWVSEWIRDLDLQVTSRERNPQFCGSPAEIRSKNFYQISPEDLTCPDPEDQLPTVASTRGPSSTTEQPTRSTTETTTTTTTTSSRSLPVSEIISGKKPTGTFSATSIVISPNQVDTPAPQQGRTGSRPIATRPPTPTRVTPPIITGNSGNSGNQRPSRPRSRPRPNLVLPGLEETVDAERDVIVKEAFLQDSSVVIQWDSETTNILGFRVVYRLFGENTFQPGPPLDPNEREFKIKNVPGQACIIVCVVSLEERNVAPETVPYAQCREMRTDGSTGSSTSATDKIIIGTSAAICGSVVLAVVIFVTCTRRKRAWGKKEGLPAILSNGTQATAVNSGNSIVGGPTASLAGMGLTMNGNQKDWDQVSMYSARSVGRARSVNGGFVPDERTQAQQQYNFNKLQQQNGLAGLGLGVLPNGRPRSIVDGQTGRSNLAAMSGLNFSTTNMNQPLMMGIPGMGMQGLQQMPLGMQMAGLGLSRQDLRASQRSMAFGLQPSSRMGSTVELTRSGSRMSRTSRSSQRREHARRRAQERAMSGGESSWDTDREALNENEAASVVGMNLSSGMMGVGMGQRGALRRQSNAGVRGRPASDTDNWTDHDMDIYTTRSAMRQDLVRL